MDWTFFNWFATLMAKAPYCERAIHPIANLGFIQSYRARNVSSLAIASL